MRRTSLLSFLFGLLWLWVSACSTNSAEPDGGFTDAGACSCTKGAQRCVGDGVQVCEQLSASCTDWGPVTQCPGACSNGRCVVNCQDSCAGGAARCADDATREACRIGPSGCLEWIKESCGPSRYCSPAAECREAVPCDPTCPSGYRCLPTGVCAEGDASNLKLNLKTVKVSGSFTINGAVPTTSAACSAQVNPSRATLRLSFYDKAQGISYDGYVLCKDAATFSFQAVLTPGTYEVRASGSDYTPSGFPFTNSGNPLLRAALVVNSDLSGQVFDLKTVRASGTFTINGAVPTTSAACSAQVNPSRATLRLSFYDKAQGISYDGYVLCRDAATFSFQTALTPGTYEVRASGSDYTPSGFPFTNSGNPLLRAALVVNSDVSGQVFDLKTVRASGTFTINGAVPTTSAACSAQVNPSRATLRLSFYDKAQGISYDGYVLCKDAATFSFQAALTPGTYEVRATGSDYTPSGFPFTNSGNPLLRAALVVNGDVSGQVFDLKTVRASGTFTINGAVPTTSAACSAQVNPSRATLRLSFYDKAQGISYDGYVLCKDAATFSFQAVLTPGTYEVRATGSDYTPSGFPFTNTGNPLLRAALVVNSDVSGQVFDLKTVRASGTFTINSAIPTTSAACSAQVNPSRATLRLSFYDKAQGISYDGYVLCRDAAAFSFQAVLTPGTYEVRASGSDYTPSGFPFTNTGNPLLRAALVVNGDVSGQVFDLKTVRASGTFTINGAVPTTSAACSAQVNPSRATLRLSFYDQAQGIGYDGYVLCKDAAAFSFQAVLTPGTYEVRASGSDYTPSGFPFTNTGNPLLVGQIRIP